MSGRAIARLAAATTLAGIIAGCVTTAPFDTARAGPARAAARVVQRDFDERGTLVIQKEQLAVEREYTVSRLTIPADEHALETTVDYYRAHVDGERPLMVMSPPLGTSRPGGKLTVERPFLTYFAKNGWDVALIYRPRIARTEDPIGDLERGMHDSVAAYRHAITHVLETPDVRTDRLCALGISMGGILTTIVAAEDPRIKYAVIALAGSTDKVLEGVDDKNPEGFLRKIAQAMTARGGKEAFLAEFRERVPTQPQHYADRLDPSRTMLIISRRDKIIPRAAAEDLRSRAGYPTTRYVHLLGHIGSFVLYPILRHDALAFFEQRIAQDDRTLAAPYRDAQDGAQAYPAGSFVTVAPPKL